MAPLRACTHRCGDRPGWQIAYLLPRYSSSPPPSSVRCRHNNGHSHGHDLSHGHTTAAMQPWPYNHGHDHLATYSFACKLRSNHPLVTSAAKFTRCSYSRHPHTVSYSRSIYMHTRTHIHTCSCTCALSRTQICTFSRIFSRPIPYHSLTRPLPYHGSPGVVDQHVK